MTTVSLIYAEDTQKLAARVRGYLEAEGITVTETPQPGAVAVVLLSPESAQEATLNDAISAALDNEQHVIPVTIGTMTLPRLIDNLQPIDATTSYDADALLERVRYLASPDAPRPLVTHTSTRQRSNRQAAYILGGIVALMFVLALIGVAAGVFQAPADEFAGVETQVYLTRNWYIDEALPRSTEDALAFETTIEAIDAAIEGTLVPYLRLTATGVSVFSESTHYPRSTAEAVDFPLTLERVSTQVQDRMAATVTARAATAEAITPTPSPAGE